MTIDPQRQPLPPPPPPRDLTPTVLRQSWSEKHVRVWWLLGLVMFAIAAYYAVSRVYTWSQERRLITHGERVEAEVMHWEPGGEASKNKIVPPDAPVSLVYSHKGQSYRVFGVLAGRKEPILTRRNVSLYIDPQDPTRWTGRTQPSPLEHELISATLLVPFVIVLIVLAFWSRRRVLRVYRQGHPVLAEVVGVAHAAAAPFSRTVRCAVHVGDDERVIKVVLPAGKAPRVGDSIWLISPPGRPELGIPAALFE